MRKALLISFGVITSLILVLFTIYFASAAVERKKFEDRMSEFEPACEEVANYLLDISGTGCQYYLYYSDVDAGYILTAVGETESTEIDIPSDISGNLASVEKAFYLLTHRNGPNFISVSGNYVVFYEDCYYGCMIYSCDGTFDKTMKDKWKKEDYQRFYQLNSNWYSVYVDLI